MVVEVNVQVNVETDVPVIAQRCVDINDLITDNDRFDICEKFNLEFNP